MLKSLRLTKFRKHESLALNFREGLTALRGANEAGKSSMLLGLAYALYGSTVLPLPLAEIVTWGCKESELRAELDLEVDGKVYTFSRAKAGAEVTINGAPFVTGQKEVSAFASQLLGADAASAMRLMFSSQGNLRGALEQGPLATATMLESLADLNIFDQVIEAMQSKLILGAPALFEQKLQQADLALAAAVEPVQPDLRAMQQEKVAAQGTLAQAEADLVPLKAVTQQTYAAFQNAESLKRMFDTLTGNLEKVQAQLATHQSQLATAEAGINFPDPDEVADLKAKLQNIKDAKAINDRHAKMAEVMKSYPVVCWYGDLASLDAELAKCDGLMDAASATVNKGKQDIKVWQSQLATSCVCPTCKQTLPDAEAMYANNSRLETLTGDRKIEVATAQANLDNAKAERADLLLVKSSARPFDAAATLEGVEANYNFVPPKLSWVGPIPGEHDDEKGILNRLNALEQQGQVARKSEGQAEFLRSAVQDDLRDVQRAGEQLADCQYAGNIDDLHKAANEAASQSIFAEVEVGRLRGVVEDLARAINTVESEYISAAAAYATLKGKVSECQSDLEKLTFNNTLLKCVRSIRPLVANKLWDQVLAGVSIMFSQIRGENSKITKSKEGFLCNGKRVEGLSGSTLDALGLSIRIALIKTFIPSCPFLILDEPTSAADEHRTSSMLGFIQASGFNQVVLVTHNHMAESVSNNFILM